VFNRDRSRIVSEFKRPGGPEDWDERHIVILPDGQKFTFENSGNVQRIFDGEGNLVSATEWTDDGPRPLPIGESAFLGPPISAGANIASRLGPAAAQALNAAALTFFTWLSSRKDPNRTAVFAFNAKKYEKPGTEENEKRPVVFVGSLTRDEVRTACKKFGKVQKITDDAVAKVTADGDYKGPADFGTKVHKEIARVINDKNNPNFRAEQSVIKSRWRETAVDRLSTRTTRRKTTTRARRATASLAQSGWMPMRTSPRNRPCASTIPRPDGAA
jgi:hypothetical protein